MAENLFKTEFNVFDAATAVVNNSSDNLKYFFRYNIITDTGEKVTEFSSINELLQDNLTNVLDGFVPNYSISSVKSGGVGINVDWTVPTSFIINKFDIYFSWSQDNITYTGFEYADTVTSNSYYIDIPFIGNPPTKAKFVKIWVQVPTSTKSTNTNAKLFESTGTTTLPILDGGTIV